MKYSIAVVGLNMGRNHCKVFNHSPYFSLEAVCDLDPERIEWVRQNVKSCAAYSDYETMLREVRPDAVVVATPNNLHGSMTIMAAEYGVKGIYCEKPMAVSMDECNQMLVACKKHKVALMIGHQRRVTPVYQTMKRLMDEGAIGKIELIRGSCAGDFLSDGTHTVDSIRYLMGDIDVKWVLGLMFRGRKATAEELAANIYQYKGHRYGHNVEEGAFSMFEFSNGVRVETTSGTLWIPKRGYQDIEVFGSSGRMLRAGDSANPELVIQDIQGGYREVSVDRPQIDESLLDGGGHGANLLERSIVAQGFADMISNGTAHPMDGDNALKTQEVVMAAYESVRVRYPVQLPLTQLRYPLDIMLENGDME